MYKIHPSINTPYHETPIWRYMDLWKFLDMLDSTTIYLSRADTFEDTFEGRIPIRKIRQLESEDTLKRLDNFSAHSLIKSTYISSWSAEEYETFPLWKIYSDYQSAVAIKTTVNKLIDSISENADVQYIGEVKYVNPKGSYIFEGNTYQLFFEKRDYFKFEKEVRLISSLSFANNDELFYLPIGVKLRINLDELITEIYLAPKATESFKSLIELKLSSLNLNKNVRFSDI